MNYEETHRDTDSGDWTSRGREKDEALTPVTPEDVIERGTEEEGLPGEINSHPVLEGCSIQTCFLYTDSLTGLCRGPFSCCLHLLSY